VVIAIVVLVVVKVSGNSTTAASSGGITASGVNPPAAPAALTSILETIPQSTYDSVGTAGEPASFTVTKGQSALTSGGKPELVYVGGEFCPYCALMRYSLITALSRFGTFSGLKLMSSAPTDGDIPTFSFVNSTYKSSYVDFSPWETQDRQENPLQQAPSYVNKLYAKYDGSGSTPAATFNTTGGAGIPFLDLGNKYVSSGDPAPMADLFASSGVLNNGGPGRTVIADAIRNPSSTVGKTISASVFIAEANYVSAGICALDGGKPSTVCSTSGVKAAAASLAAAKPVG